MKKVSVMMNTARDDYSLQAYPDKHMLYYTIDSLLQQTCQSFELVIADGIYEQRKDLFKDWKGTFPIIHVPMKPNVWSPRGLCAISTSKNTALLWANGEYGIFIDDCAWIDPEFIERTVEWIDKGYIVSSLMEVYDGEKLIVPCRERPFTLGHYYNNMAMKMTDWEFFNGYDEMFDGAKCLEDCDLSNRVHRAGRKLMRITPHIKYQHHTDIAKCCRKLPAIKCNHLWAEISNSRAKNGIFRANSVPVSDDEFEMLLSCNKNVAGDICRFVNLPCNFITPDGKAMSGADPELMALYRHPSLVFNLAEQRLSPNKAIEELKRIVL